MSIAITDELSRGSSGTAPFPLASEANMKVSYVTVSDDAGRDAIPEWKRLAYMLCYVSSTDITYRLGSDITIAGQVWTVESFGIPEEVLTEDEILTDDGFIKPELIQNVFLNDNFVVDSEVAMLALSTRTGNFVIRTDTGDIYVKLNNDDPSDIGDFAEITYPGTVVSVNGLTGVVNITITDLITADTAGFNTKVGATTTITDILSDISTIEGDIVTIDATLATKADLVTGTVPLAQLPYSFSNGLTDTAGAVTLGGPITNSIIIDGVETYDFTLKDIVNLSFLISNSLSIVYDDGVDTFTLIADSNAGLRYTTDLTATFTELSLITKQYVDQQVTNPFDDNNALVNNFTDPTKLAIFSAASISTGTTRTYTLPDANGTILLGSSADYWKTVGITTLSTSNSVLIQRAASAATAWLFSNGDSGSSNYSELSFSPTSEKALKLTSQASDSSTGGEITIQHNQLVLAGPQGGGYIQILAPGVLPGIRIGDSGSTGLNYEADYSASGIANWGDRWIPDRGYIDSNYWKVADTTNLTATASINIGDNTGRSLRIFAGAGIGTVDSVLIDMYDAGDGLPYLTLQSIGSIAGDVGRVSIHDGRVELVAFNHTSAEQFNLIFNGTSNTAKFTDARAAAAGIEYAADYSVTFTDRSLIDKGYALTNFWATSGTTNLSGSPTIIAGNENSIELKALSDNSFYSDLLFYAETSFASAELKAIAGGASAGILTKINGADHPSNSWYLGLGGFITKLEMSYGFGGVKITDTLTSIGASYAADYSTQGILTYGDRWIPDKGYIDTFVAANNWLTSGTTTLSDDVLIDAGTDNDITFQTSGLSFFNIIAPLITLNGSVFITDGFNVQQDTLGESVLTVTSLSVNDSPNFQIFQNRVTTTDATVTTIHTIPIPANTTVYIDATVIARRTGGSAGTAEDGAAIHVEQVFKNVAGTATQIGSLSSFFSKRDQLGWDFRGVVSGSNVLLQVTGAINNDVVWHLSELKVSKVST